MVSTLVIIGYGWDFDLNFRGVRDGTKDSLILNRPTYSPTGLQERIASVFSIFSLGLKQGMAFGCCILFIIPVSW